MPEQAIDINSRALLEGLVYNEEVQPAQVVTIGGVAHYAIPDDGFLRHVEARGIDDAVLDALQEQVSGMQDELVTAILKMLQQDDIFTKAAVESSINNMEEAVGNPIPAEARQYLGMLGFRVVIDDQGNVVDLSMPGGGAEEE